MSTQADKAQTTTDKKFEPANVNVRMKISALWAAMLFVFAYMDIFGHHRPDVRADIEAGVMGPFTIDQGFLLGITVYVLIPSLMVFATLVLGPRVNRIVNIALGSVYALVIAAGAIGEGTTTSSAVPSRSLCWSPSSTTRGPGRN